MTTRLTKPIHRKTVGSYYGPITDARGRELVVTLMPGDLVGIRPKGRRSTETIPISTVYEMAFWARIRAAKKVKNMAGRRRK